MRRHAAAIALAAILAACSRETPAPPTHPPASAAAVPHDGGRLIRRLESEVNTLNFVLHTTDYEHYVLDYLCDPIIGLDREMKPIPATATSWEVSPDGRTFTFHLDPKSTFSDGTPVKASDFIFTLHKILDEQSPQFVTWFDQLDREQTKALDDHTVVAVFKQARPAQLLAFNIAILPEHVYGKGDFKKDHNKTAVGNGPYRVARWEEGQSILLERRADYAGTRPHLDSILFKIVSDHAVAFQAVKRGDLDETRVPNDMWFLARNQPDVQQAVSFLQGYRLAINCILWNERNPVLADKTVRRALAMSYDRQRIIDAMYHGAARPLTGPFPPDQWANDPSVKPIGFDPAGARRMLGAAGWKDADGDGILERGGRKLSFEIVYPVGDTIGTAQTQIFQAALRPVGIDMRIRTMDGATFFERVMRGEGFDAAIMAWTLDPDPDVYPLFHSKQVPPAGLNVVHYANPEVDRLIEEARGVLDPARRTELFHQIHRLLADDQPYLWTVQVAVTYAIRHRVHGVRDSQGLGLFSWYPGPREWWVD